MIEICLTCANNKAGQCTVLNKEIIPDFICDFYSQKRTGAFRRKKAKLNRGNEITFIIGERGAGKKYVMSKMKGEKN